jgi:extradiol dioxygenase family protein
MKELTKIFHLAIPCRDVGEAIVYYQDKLGCRLARKYPNRATFDFFGTQLVCHLHPSKIDRSPEEYPRHFGSTLLNREEFDKILEHSRREKLPFFTEPHKRCDGLPEEHLSFMLIDPSNNLIEFKHYNDAKYVY